MHFSLFLLLSTDNNPDYHVESKHKKPLKFVKRVDLMLNGLTTIKKNFQKLKIKFQKEKYFFPQKRTRKRADQQDTNLLDNTHPTSASDKPVTPRLHSSAKALTHYWGDDKSQINPTGDLGLHFHQAGKRLPHTMLWKPYGSSNKLPSSTATRHY